MCLNSINPMRSIIVDGHTDETGGTMDLQLHGKRAIVTGNKRHHLAANVSIGRIVDAEEVAWVVAFLASPRSVAVNGDTVAVGGGTRGPSTHELWVSLTTHPGRTTVRG
jgi:NAD(P)-dependent dehydrogenase (short-subunit alcohol dehydrogenase family)